MTKIWILLAVPDCLNVSVLALGVPKSYEDCIVNYDTDASKDWPVELVGAEAAAWLNANAAGRFEFYWTRNFERAIRTATYAKWLVLTENAVANAFVAAFPQFQQMVGNNEYDARKLARAWTYVEKWKVAAQS